MQWCWWGAGEWVVDVSHIFRYGLNLLPSDAANLIGCFRNVNQVFMWNCEFIFWELDKTFPIITARNHSETVVCFLWTSCFISYFNCCWFWAESYYASSLLVWSCWSFESSLESVHISLAFHRFHIACENHGKQELHLTFVTTFPVLFWGFYLYSYIESMVVCQFHC